MINQVNDYQTAIASAVEEQAATTAEISRSVSFVVDGMSRITTNAAVLVRSTDRTGTATEVAIGAVGQTQQLAEQLEGLVRRFTD